AYVVDSPALKALTGASDADAAAAARVLEQGGVVVSDPDMVVDGQATMEVETLSYDEETGNEERVGEESFTLPAHALTTGNAGPEQTLLSQEAADALGYVRYSTVMLFETSRMPTQDEQEVLQETLINAGLAMDYSASGASGGPVDSSESVMVNVEVVEEQSSEVQTVLLLLGVVSGLLALGATAVATALAAAESRRDLGTLAAIGASPTMRRKLSLFQAGTISLLGAGLGVLAGVGACAAAIAAFNTTLSGLYPIQELYPLSMPWLNIVLALAVVPLVAMLGAGLLTRSRLPSERRAG
ncbi:MAG: FtsX-like permease family protein, partial [Stackebrandtia sp.]